MNTTAEPLQIYDIVVAQLEAGIGESLHDLVGAAKEACPAIFALLRWLRLWFYTRAHWRPREAAHKQDLSVANEFGPNMTAHWNELIMGMTRAAEFLEEERIFDAS